MKKYLIIGILLLVALSMAILGKYHMQGAIVAKDFSHDLRLLHYNGWQYTLRQPSNYRDFKTLEFRFWHDVYDNSDTPKLMKSYRPETAWTKSPTGLSRELPIDILVKQVSGLNSSNWSYTATLDYSGTGHNLIHNDNDSSSWPLQEAVKYEENTPMLIGEMTVYKQPRDETRTFRFYLEIAYTKHE